ncbi:MAG: GGDEF domain-containing phosphodiesterase, partial [Oscillospiraceae bacterium]
PYTLAISQLFNHKKERGGVLKLYLENFKLFDDMFGYAYGELLLKEVATFLSSIPNAQVFRYSGVSYIIILERQSYSQVMDVAQTLQERFEASWHINDMDYMCAVSIGMICYPDAAKDAAEVLPALEYAVNEASRNGQNAIVVFDGDLQQKLYRKQMVSRLLSDAINSDLLEVRYRPTADLQKGIFSRAELYMRLLSADLGVISSAELISAAEDSGQICALNSYAIDKVCKQIRRLLDAEIDFESIAVPISPIQFLQDRFLDDMKEMLEQYQIPPHKLAFEITESILINSFSKVNITMQELAELGIELILNEFGTGYSGINNILDLPVDVLKLEKMFVCQLETNPRSGILIEGLIQIAHKLGMKLIAEGVETENQFNLLKEYNCRYEQGFYYSPTVDENQLLEMLGKPFA